MTENRFTPRRFAWNTLLYLANNIMMKPMAIAVGALLARGLGPDGFGRYSLALALLTSFLDLADLGTSKIALRNISRNEKEANRELGSAIALKLLLGAAVFLTANALYLAMGYPPDFRFMLFCGSVQFLFGFSSLYILLYQSRLQMALPLTIGFLGEAGFMLSVFYMALFKPSVFWVLVSRVFFTNITGLILILASRPIARPIIRFDREKAANFLREGWPIGMVGFLIYLYCRIDILMIGKMLGTQAVGHYSSALALTESLGFVPLVYSASLFPTLSAFFMSKPETFDRTANQSVKLMLLCVLPAAFGITALKGPIINLIYGYENYTPAIAPLGIHAWTLVLIYVNSMFNTMFSAMGKQKLYFLFNVAGLGFNFLTNLIFIPLYGIAGAAGTTFFTHAVVAALAIGALKNEGRKFRVDGVWKIALASLATALVAHWTFEALDVRWTIVESSGLKAVPQKIYNKLPTLIAIAAGAIVYLPAIAALRAFNPDDIALLKKILRRP